MRKAKSVGVYVGSFDPVHSGNIAFALQANDELGFDSVYFLPERFPHHIASVTHSTHRAAMILRAIRPHTQLGLLEVVDKRFTFARTIPKLLHQFRGAHVYLLLDAQYFIDYANEIANRHMLKNREIGYVVSVKSAHESSLVVKAMQENAIAEKSVRIIKNIRPNVSSDSVRGALELGVQAKGVLPSVRRYAREAWLYIRLPRR